MSHASPRPHLVLRPNLVLRSCLVPRPNLALRSCLVLRSLLSSRLLPAMRLRPAGAPDLPALPTCRVLDRAQPVSPLCWLRRPARLCDRFQICPPNGLTAFRDGRTLGNVDRRPGVAVVRAEEAVMRVTVRVLLGVVTAVLGTMLLVGIAAEPAVAASQQVVHVAVVHHAAAAAPVTTAPAAGTGTNYNQGQQAANAALAKRKLILAGICVVLLVIVYYGHRAKYKHVLRVKNLQNAKS